jgi:hypothetical protein
MRPRLTKERPTASRTYVLVRRSAISAALVLGAIVADGAGAHGLALYLVLAAIVAVAIAALAFFGELVEGSADAEAGAVYVGLTSLALVLLVIGAAVRANTLPDRTVPALGMSTVVGALALLGLQLAVWTTLRVSRDRLIAAAQRLGSDA